MANRMISYGYRIDNGKIVVIPSEAEIVKQIFCDYASGKILKEIAADLTERGVEFFEGKSNWNKNTVVRIIQNGKYIGENDYPVIVDADVFERVNRLKCNKGHKKEKNPEVIEYLKEIVFCGGCGKSFHRRINWGTHEKWCCLGDCKNDKYIDDNYILSGVHRILCAVNAYPQLVEKYECEPTYTKTQDIVRYTNEIGRYMNEQMPSFKTGKKLIMECATIKFSACKFNANAKLATFITKQLANAQEYLQKDFLRKIIERIIVNYDGSISLRFMGGIVVSEADMGEGYGNASQKDCNED